MRQTYAGAVLVVVGIAAFIVVHAHRPMTTHVRGIGVTLGRLVLPPSG
jgi:hypothetical protein